MYMSSEVQESGERRGTMFGSEVVRREAKEGK